LVSGLSAIDELKQEADENKQKVEELEARLQYLTSEKETADLELKEIRKIAASDIGTFQEVVGVPSRGQIAKERLVGFDLGFLLRSWLRFSGSNGQKSLHGSRLNM
jgi:hypothetical protein